MVKILFFTTTSGGENKWTGIKTTRFELFMMNWFLMIFHFTIVKRIHWNRTDLELRLELESHAVGIFSSMILRTAWYRNLSQRAEPSQQCALQYPAVLYYKIMGLPASWTDFIWDSFLRKIFWKNDQFFDISLAGQENGIISNPTISTSLILDDNRHHQSVRQRKSDDI